MRRDLDFFTDTELELVQVSRRLKEALGVEDLLTRSSIDYSVEADTYHAKFLVVFPVQRVGAFFWVRSAEAERVRSLLSESGITATWPEAPEASDSSREESP